MPGSNAGCCLRSSQAALFQGSQYAVVAIAGVMHLVIAARGIALGSKPLFKSQPKVFMFLDQIAQCRGVAIAKLDTVAGIGNCCCFDSQKEASAPAFRRRSSNWSEPCWAASTIADEPSPYGICANGRNEGSVQKLLTQSFTRSSISPNVRADIWRRPIARRVSSCI